MDPAAVAGGPAGEGGSRSAAAAYKCYMYKTFLCSTALTFRNDKCVSDCACRRLEHPQDLALTGIHGEPAFHKWRDNHES